APSHTPSQSPPHSSMETSKNSFPKMSAILTQNKRKNQATPSPNKKIPSSSICGHLRNLRTKSYPSSFLLPSSSVSSVPPWLSQSSVNLRTKKNGPSSKGPVSQSTLGSYRSTTSPLSPVRMRIASSTGDTKILPSPMRPVEAAFTIASTTVFSCSSLTTISS